MPLKNYKLLIGRVRGLQLDNDEDPHIEVLVHAKGEVYRIAVNVRSKESPHDLLYRRFESFHGPTLPALEALLEDGVIDIKNSRADLAFDYVHDHLFERTEMSVAPYEAQGPDNDLKDFLLPLLQKAISDDSRIFAFGEMFGPESKPDEYFHFTPGQGIHDIHMNQGNTGGFAGTNGAKQDGALLLRHPDGNWTAIFLGFQTQRWEGAPVTSQPGSVSIVAALINARGQEEGAETVTLFNRGDSLIDLAGWKIRDRNARTDLIGARSIPPGETLRVTLSGQGARLGNASGEIHLIAADDSIAHSISYQATDDPEGWSQLFPRELPAKSKEHGKARP